MRLVNPRSENLLAWALLAGALAGSSGCTFNPVEDPGGFAMTVTGIVVGSIVLSLLPFFKIFGSMGKRRKILQQGLPAQARVLGVSGTGVHINHQPQLAITLQVIPPGGHPPYQATANQVVPQYHMPQIAPGALVQIKVDREDQQSVTIDFGATSAMAAQAGAPAQAQAPMPGAPMAAGPPPAAAAAPMVRCGYCARTFAGDQPKCPNCGAPKPIA